MPQAPAPNQNAALAEAFEQIADYLELKGENPFKIRAYKRAAEAVSELPFSVDEAETEQLEAVEGLGAATIAKTREWVATGTIRLLEYLKDEFPVGLLEVSRVPGLGSKKVALLYKERGIDSLESFAAALNEGQLEGVSGFGPKTIENLKTALRRMAELTARLPRTRAVGVAEKLKAALREKLPNLEIHDAGSLRRGVDTLGNINFVASTNEPEATLDAFASLPIVVEIVSRDRAKIVARVPPGVEVELVVCAPDALGSTLFRQTGSVAHLETAGVSSTRFVDEVALYQSLGVPFIPPELRENRGEWAAAKAGTLPHLVDETQIRGDLHSHSTWSDGVATIRQMAEAARARGYAYFAVTDHSKALAMANGLNADRLREQALEIAEVQRDFPDLKIFRGIECDILRDGTMDLDDEILSELDIVIGSVHSGFNLSLEAQTARVVAAMRNPHVDLIAHPTGRVLGARAPYDIDISALIEAAIETRTALEINASERLDLKDEHAFAAREAGVLLCINTDAHSPKMFSNLHFGVTVARRAWCSSTNVLNCQTVEQLMRWLKERK